jgi:hypothetical protein
MSQFYDRLAALDKGVADRWKARTHDDPRHKLTSDDVRAIMLPLFGQKGKWIISKSQAEAIAALIPELDGPGAAGTLMGFIQAAENYEGLELEPLEKESDISPVLDALAQASPHHFTNPQGHLTYWPADYMAVRQLITEKKIHIFRANISVLNQFTREQAFYRSDKNVLVLYRGIGPETVVHEATHVIQDWRDLKIRTRNAEADAFIAGYATQHVKPAYFENDLRKAAFSASRHVINASAKLTNADWRRAYDNVVKLVNPANGYDDPGYWNRNKGKGETESDQYKSILEQLRLQRTKGFPYNPKSQRP